MQCTFPVITVRRKLTLRLKLSSTYKTTWRSCSLDDVIVAARLCVQLERKKANEYRKPD